MGTKIQNGYFLENGCKNFDYFQKKYSYKFLAKEFCKFPRSAGHLFACYSLAAEYVPTSQFVFITAANISLTNFPVILSVTKLLHSLDI
jgi:hypothetical protein